MGRGLVRERSDRTNVIESLDLLDGAAGERFAGTCLKTREV
jgi:hypothetical protein